VDEDEFRSALLDYADHVVSAEFQPAVSLNINSPGIGSLRAATFVPIFFAALFVLFANGDTAEQPKPSDVTIVNSGELTETDECAARVSEAIRETLRLMGYDQWKAQCLRAKRLRDAAGLSVDSTNRGDR
jgi:hypothetical protein